MKYHMRRAERRIEDWEAMEEVLRGGRFATLAFCRDNEPYIATLSYGYESSTRSLYFHCAKDGLKTEFVTANPRVCATIVRDGGYRQGECAHAYRSLVIRGSVEVLEDDGDKRRALDVMIEHLEERPEAMRAKMPDRKAQFDVVAIWKLAIEEISGKEGT